MAGLASTFRRYFHDNASPFAQAADVYAGFEPIVGITPAAILGSLESPVYPLPLLLANGNHTPFVALAPFSPGTLPGVPAPADKFAFGGDVSNNGALPSLLTLTTGCFHLTDVIQVLNPADTSAAWAALGPNEPVLPVPAGAGMQDVRTWNAVPIPHQYAEIILDAHANGLLTWRWLWANVGEPIRADPQQHADLEPFLNYLLVSSTKRAPTVAGDPPRNPATERAYAAVFTMPILQDKAASVAAHFLPGLRQPTGVGAQLAVLAIQQQQLQQVINLGQQPRTATLASKYPSLLMQTKRMCEVPQEDDLAPYWVQFPGLKSGAWLSNLKSVIGMPSCLPMLHSIPPLHFKLPTRFLPSRAVWPPTSKQLWPVGSIGFYIRPSLEVIALLVEPLAHHHPYL